MPEPFSAGDFPPNPIEKDDYILEFHDEFDNPDLNTNKWQPFYLPHWSSQERSKPNYKIEDGSIVLQITQDQQPWCPEFDGKVKCSSIQTGQFSGPVGSVIGQHRFNPALVVREEQLVQQKYVPLYGYFECRARGLNTNGNHVALWMIGFDDVPERSGEIAVFEIMGATVRDGASRVGHGIRRWGDPRLEDEFYEPYLPLDAAHFHIYALEWLPTHLEFFIDNVKIRTIRQSPDYPMQFFLSIYELPAQSTREEQSLQNYPYPKQFTIDYFRAYQPINGYHP